MTDEFVEPKTRKTGMTDEFVEPKTRKTGMTVFIGIVKDVYNEWSAYKIIN